MNEITFGRVNKLIKGYDSLNTQDMLYDSGRRYYVDVMVDGLGGDVTFVYFKLNSAATDIRVKNALGIDITNQWDLGKDPTLHILSNPVVGSSYSFRVEGSFPAQVLTPPVDLVDTPSIAYCTVADIKQRMPKSVIDKLVNNEVRTFIETVSRRIDGYLADIYEPYSPDSPLLFPPVPDTQVIIRHDVCVPYVMSEIVKHIKTTNFEFKASTNVSRIISRGAGMLNAVIRKDIRVPNARRVNTYPMGSFEIK